jgi:hypothetical protein
MKLTVPLPTPVTATSTPYARLLLSNRIFFANVSVKTCKLKFLVMASRSIDVSELDLVSVNGSIVLAQFIQPRRLPSTIPGNCLSPSSDRPAPIYAPDGPRKGGYDTWSGPPSLL